MRKSIGTLLGLVAVLSACGTPSLVSSPAASVTAAATAKAKPDNSDFLFDTLEAHFQIKAPASMGMTNNKYGPAWSFITVAPKPSDPALTEVNVGAITNAGKITTSISFASRLDRTRNTQVEEVKQAAKAHAQRLGSDIQQLIVSTNPKGFDKYSYLVIGKRPNDPNQAIRNATFFHVGTYTVGTRELRPTLDIGTTITR